MSKEWESRVEVKLDRLDERLDAVDKNLAVYNVLLDKHIEATEINRQQIAKIRERTNEVVYDVDGIKRWPKQLLTIVGLASTLLGIVALVIQLLGKS